MKLGRKKSKDSAGQDDPPKKKQKSLQVSKVEVSDNKVKFYVAKGLFKKKWIVVTEIPVLEIERIEKFGNELNVTWKGISSAFSSKGKTDLFGKLADQVNAILAENVMNQQQKSEETKAQEEKAALRKTELLGVINSSVGLIDQSFNVLICLQEKRINWQKIEVYSKKLGENPSFTGQTMPPLSLDFSKIASAIKNQIPKDTSNEAYTLLETTYNYFDGLNLDEDNKENHPNLQDAKSVILGYFMLNDLLLGSVVGDKDNNEEISELESVIGNLPAASNFKVDVEQVKKAINKLDVANKREAIIEGSRGIFRQQLKQQFKPSPPPTLTPLAPKDEVFTGLPPESAAVEPASPVIKEEAISEPVIKEEAIAEPASKVEVVSEPISKEAVISESVPKEPKEITAEPAIKEEVTEEPAAKVEFTSEPAAKEEAVQEPIPKEEVSFEPVFQEKAAVEQVPKEEVVAAEPAPAGEVVRESVSTAQVAVEPTSEAEVAEAAEPASKAEISTASVSKEDKKQERILVSKVEVSDNIAKFFVAKGLFSKRWIVVKEIPLSEIEHVDKFGNELSVTWKGAVYTFFSKEKTDVFRQLFDQVKAMLEGASSEPPAAPVASAEPVAQSEVANEPVLAGEVAADPVSEDAGAKPVKAAEPAIKEADAVSKDEATAEPATETATSPPAENQPAPQEPRRRLRRNRNKAAPSDSGSKAQP